MELGSWKLTQGQSCAKLGHGQSPAFSLPLPPKPRPFPVGLCLHFIRHYPAPAPSPSPSPLSFSQEREAHVVRHAAVNSCFVLRTCSASLCGDRCLCTSWGAGGPHVRYRCYLRYLIVHPLRTCFDLSSLWTGTTITGEEFDSSFKRGQPATFAPNQVCILQVADAALPLLLYQSAGHCVQPKLWCARSFVVPKLSHNLKKPLT